jgi:hypothetical protein
MKRPRSLCFLLAFAAAGALASCDAPTKDAAAEKRTEEQASARPEAKVEPPKRKPKKSWYEGPFRGQAELSPVSLEDKGEAKKEGGKAKASDTEEVKPAEPLALSLDLVLSAEGVTGSAVAQGEALVVSGTVDASALRLTLGGETARGTFVGHGDEEKSTFQGVVRLLRTETQERKVSREAYAGKLVLTGSE